MTEATDAFGWEHFTQLFGGVGAEFKTNSKTSFN